jgi:uncharacterized protein (TIGR00369 family)
VGEPFEGVGTVDLVAIRQFFDVGIPFNKFLGLTVTEIERGRLVAEVPFRPEFIGNPIRKALHGGVISMLADTVGGAALFTLTDPGDQVATIDLRVDYLRPGRDQTLVGEGTVVRLGNRVGVSAIEVYHPDRPDQPVAVAKGVYNVSRAGDR